MLLLAITLLVVFFAALGFRHTLPRYVNEIRLLLNIGPVREGERVMYQGLPMEVRSLNLFVILRNPDLEGIVRLPLSALDQLVSRPFAKTEPWFPCRAGDYVMLPDGTFGQVQRQTLEHVVLQSIGSSVLYSSAAFLQANARNLSREGYAIVATFGLDYRHQAISLDTVPARLRDALIEAFRQADFGDALESLLVEFKAAAAHSLDYLIVASLNGCAASAYYRASRLVQQTCVAVCNQEHWVIPFNQLTLHQGEGFARLARQTSE